MRLYPIWNIIHADPYDDLIEALLKARGLTRESLQVGPETLFAPELLQDMSVAVDHLERAIRSGD